MARVLPIDTPTLGDRSYLVHDGRVAFVVDPQRDIDRVLDLAAAEGVQVTHVFETHIHNDYVTGGYALAAATGAAYHVNRDDPVAFDRVGVTDGDVIAVGESMQVRVIANPGHTFTHLSYALMDFGQPVSGLLGRVTAVRVGGPAGPARPGTHPHSGAPSVRVRATGSRPNCPAPLSSIPRTGSAASAPPARAKRALRPWPRRSKSIRYSSRTRRPLSTNCSQVWTPGPPTTRTWVRRTPPARPLPICPHRTGPTPNGFASGSPTASGWSTCATGSPSPPDTWPAR